MPINVENLLTGSRPFLEWVAEWYNTLERPRLDEVVSDPEQTAVLSVDVIEGFCRTGPLASERVEGIVGSIVALFKGAHALGVRKLILIEDQHPADAVEFGSYGPHCVAGTAEAETAAEIAALPFFKQMVRWEKNSISSSINTKLNGWLFTHPEVNTFIVVGDCTDLCIYQLAMHLRLRANARQEAGVRVIVPVEGVDTFDLPVAAAQEIGAVPHDAELLHLIFLYSMMENGIEIVSGLES